MNEILCKRLDKLFSVKSIVTIALTIAFVIQTLTGRINSEFLTIYTVVIGFYFGTQSRDEKTAAGDGK